MNQSRQVRKKKTLALDEIQKSLSDQDDGSQNAKIEPNEDRVGEDQQPSISEEEEELNKRLKELDMFEPGMNLEEKRQILESVDASMNTAKEEDVIRQNMSTEPSDTNRNKTIPRKAVTCYEEWICPKQSHSSKSITVEQQQNPGKHNETKSVSKDGSSPVDIVDIDSNEEGLTKCSKDIDIVVQESSDEDSDEVFTANKKRPTTEIKEKETLKRFKCDSSKNGSRFRIICAQRTESIQIRPISTIIKELDECAARWKDARSKIKQPVYWSKPYIAKASGEIIRGDYIPDQLMLRYQQYLKMRGLKTSVFYPQESQQSDDGSTDADIKYQLQHTPDSVIEDTQTSISYKEESSSSSNNEDEGWQPSSSRKKKQVPAAKQRYKKTANKTKAIMEVESESNTNRLNGISLENKMLEDEGSQVENKEGRVTRSTTKRSVTFPSTPSSCEKVICPVCNQLYETSLIENHATECARKMYQD